MILFMISNYSGINTGRGGHYYSLKQMSESIGELTKTLTVVLGDEPPMVLQGRTDACFVKSSLLREGTAAVNVLTMLAKLKVEQDVTVVHAYDSGSAYVGLEVAKKLGAKFLLTKCGGKIPKWYYPEVDSLVVFHKADQQYFQKKSAFKQVYLIPHRVKPVQQSQTRISDIVDHDVFTIIKIGRLTRYYYKTLAQSIGLASKLQLTDKPVRLLFIGYPESDELIDELICLAELQNVNLYILTDDKFTNNASELIWACDAAIGTGRGAMEVLSTGKILFFPVANSTYPCLFCEETAQYAIYENFSERVVLPMELMKYCNPVYVKEVLNNEIWISKLKLHNLEVFRRYYDSREGAARLIDIYESDLESTTNLSSLKLLKLRGYHFVIGLRRACRLLKARFVTFIRQWS